MYKRLLFPVAGLIFGIHINARCLPHDHPVTGGHEGTVDFIENKGQWVSEAKFRAEIPGGVVFLTDKGFVYHFASGEDMHRIHDLACRKHAPEEAARESATVRFHAYRVNFTGAGSSIAYAGASVRSYYHNYFIGNDPAKWAGRVGLYGVVEQRNVYDGIDVRVYGNEAQSLKYDFIVAPGANPRQIVLSFDGVAPALTKEGDLRIVTTVNEVTEEAPYVYQDIEGRRIEVKSRYVLQNGALTFAFPEGYNDRYALVIDPTLIFSTFSGGASASEFYAHSNAYDKAGNTYTAALAAGIGWPTTTGAYQTTFPGGSTTGGTNTFSVAVNKYNSDGSALLFSTYFGGTGLGAVQPNTIRVNDAGEMVLAGNVTNPRMPVTAGAYQSVMNGGSDIYIARFSQDGSTLLASTFIGGSGEESLIIGSTTSYYGLGSTAVAINPADIAFDSTGNIWVTSNSGSSDFPVTGDAYQPASGGSHDVVLFKMPANLDTLLYGTYLGGAGWDGGIGIEYNRDHNTIGLVGYTGSAGFPVTPGAYKTTRPGGVDGFALLMDNSTYQLQAATYLGTTAADIAMRLAFDCAGNFYVAGRTLGNYPMTATQAQGAVSYGYIFIDKLTPDLSASVASTRTGSNITPEIVPSGMTVDVCGNILVATITPYFLQSDMPLTSDAFERDRRAFYFASFAPDFSGLVFGSYYGGRDPGSPTLTGTRDHYHPGISRIDPDGNVYHSVCTDQASGWPTTPGAYAPVKQNNKLDNATFKFRIDAAGIAVSTSGSVRADETYCVRGCKPAYLHFTRLPRPEAVTLRYRISGDAVNGVDYQQIPDSVVIGAGQASATLTIRPLQVPNPSPPDPRHVIITTLSSCSCANDAAISTDTVWIYDSLHAEIITPLDTTCPGDEITITAKIDSGLHFVWSPAQQIPDISGLTIRPRPETTTTYSLTVFQPGAPSGCPPRTIRYTATVEPYPARISVPRNIVACPGDSVNIAVSAEPEGIAYRYQWSPPEYLRNDHDPVNRFFALASGAYQKVIAVSTPVANCTIRDSFIITVLPPFEFDRVWPADTTIRRGDAIQLHSEGEAVRWNWSPDTYLDFADRPQPRAKPLDSMVYMLVGFDQYGCTDTALVKINVVYHSVMDVPNAFTPNGDGKNDLFRMTGLEQEQLLEFRVFNRFGELVFETLDPKGGWNGTFKGKPADVGAYFYTIRVILPDGTTKTFRGDVTLVR